MNILVFGGSGFLGSYVVDELVKRGHRVHVFDAQPSRYLADRNDMIIGDIMQSEAVHGAVKGHDVVYNFAGLADLNRSISAPVETISLNVMGNLNILEACRIHKVDRYVYASSAYVFSRKGAFYGVSKKCSESIIEEFAHQFDLGYTVIRYGSVYGERGDATNRIYRILRQALVEKKITFTGDGSEEREYIHGRDAAKLSADILSPEFRNQRIILTGTERFRYRDLLQMVNEMLGNRIQIEFLEQDYQGHYVQTPYSFTPTVGTRLINNPCTDFGQGLLECIEHLYRELQQEGLVKHDATLEIRD